MLHDMFDSAATLQVIARVSDSGGGNTTSWATDTADIACRVVQMGAREREIFGARGVAATHVIFLYTSSTYEVTEKNRLLIDSIVYRILAVNTRGFAGIAPYYACACLEYRDGNTDG